MSLALRRRGKSGEDTEREPARPSWMIWSYRKVRPQLPSFALPPPRTPGARLTPRTEYEAEDARYARLDLRHERKLDRKAQKEQLDELVPRAEPGTRERQLEKKREVNDKMRSFRDKSPGGEVDDDTLMGGGDAGAESFAQKKAALARKKNDRELRREQLLKARIEEREERVRGMKEKEEKTMAMLKALASSRFGGPE